MDPEGACTVLACAQVQSYKSRVLFKAACAAIPEDAVLLEVRGTLKSEAHACSPHTFLGVTSPIQHIRQGCARCTVFQEGRQLQGL